LSVNLGSHSSVAVWVVPDLERNHTAFIFRVKQLSLTVTPAGEGAIIIRNVGRHSHTHTAPHPMRFKSSKNFIPKWLVLRCNQKVPITSEGFGRLLDCTHKLSLCVYALTSICIPKERFKRNCMLLLMLRGGRGNRWFGSHSKCYRQSAFSCL